MCFFVFNFEAQANSDVSPLRSRIDALTLSKGFTFDYNQGKFKFGVTPEAIVTEKTLSVVIKKQRKAEAKRTIYSYDLNSRSEININKPLWVSLKIGEKIDLDNYDVFLKYWDKAQHAWVEIPATLDREQRLLKAGVFFNYVKLAVFKAEKNYQLGQASWYDWYGAASNDYPMHTKLLVTNTDNNQSVVVEVVSTGPFIPGRIIDLPKDAFSTIGSLSAGVINVKVQPYD